jgi:hypothetical protein
MPKRPHSRTTHRRPEPARPGCGGILSLLGLYFLADNIIGCLIAAIVAPIFFGGLFGFLYWRHQNERAEDEKRAIGKTEAALTKASDTIQQETRRLGRMPYEDEGNARLRHSHDDGWRNPVTYEVTGETSYLIRSTGSDRRRNTEDDLTVKKIVVLEPRRNASSSVQDTGPPGPSASEK